MASVRKLTKANREGKFPWVVEYTDAAGKRRRATPKSGLKKDADAMRREIEAQLDRGVHVAKSQSATVKEAAEAWLRDCERRNRIGDRMAGGTLVKNQGLTNNHVVPHLGHHRISAIKFEHCQDFINARSEFLASSTLNNVRETLNQILAFAVSQRWLVLSPLTGRLLRVPKGPYVEVRIPTKAEAATLFEALFRREPGEVRRTFDARITLVLLGAFAGLRRGEICGLQWENVDLDAEDIHVRHSQSYYDGLKGPKSESGNRTVPLAPAVANYLRGLRERSPTGGTGYVVLNRSGEPFDVNALGWVYRRLMARAGLVTEQGLPLFTLHKLRHFNVSMLSALGLTPFQIKKLVGHASISTTMDVYGHLFKDDDSSRKAITASTALFDQMRQIPALAAPPRA